MNRLGDSTSAYLRSAAHQPVHWHGWGADAFSEARAADRPVLLDIGAVWCHWCHVMDHESYEDPTLAEFLNAHFVCVKVDRDERPDVDARYQRAVQALVGQGGWPLTAILDGNGDVFYGGTYFPPSDRWGRPGLRTVLERVLAAWRERRDEVGAQARTIRRFVEAGMDESRSGTADEALLDGAVDRMRAAFDPLHGGFGQEPKFPHPGAVSLLLTRWADTGDAELRTIVMRTLHGMAAGGIHDQLGGGFHRYSVDARWIVPHFEKMASDNAELLRIYADAGAAFGDPECLRAARGIVGWVRDVLAHPDGGYGTSQDADVGPEDDGGYFTWSRDEAAAVLDPFELEVAAAHWDIGTAGEMHHDPSQNVLFVAESAAAIAHRLQRSEAEVGAALTRAAAKLRDARARRPAPYVDLSRYTAWNAMLAGALLRAAPVLADDWADRHALRTLERMRAAAPAPDALDHGDGGATGLLDDQVHTAAAALDAAEATGDAAWIDWAAAIMDRVWQDYRDDDGGLYDVARGTGGPGLLPSRARQIQDAPAPSANGVAAATCARLAGLTGEARWQERAGELLRAFAGRAGELGVHAAAYLQALDWNTRPPAHVVIVGPAGDPTARELHRQARAAWLPRRLIQRVTPGADVQRLPAPVRAMATASSGARGYLCIGAVCSAPSDDSAQWAAVLAAAHRSSIPEAAES